MKKNIGAPPRYKTVKQMQEKIDEYFKKCEEGELWIDDDGKPITTDKGALIYKVPPKPPTVTGLALALGFNSRQSLLNYQDKSEFMDTVTRAKSRVEEYAETRLFDKDGANGAKFSLANNFRGWSDKSEVKATVSIEDYLKKLGGDYEY